MVIGFGGMLDGDGTVEATQGVWFERGGVLAPGYPFGQLTIRGTLKLEANSRTIIQLGAKNDGTVPDHVAVTDSVTITGNLEVELASNFTANIGDTYPILTSSSRTGTFAMFCGPPLAGRRTLRPSYGPTNVVLSVQLIATYAEWTCSRFTFA